MGDYIKDIKIGTCGNAYYATKPHLESYASHPEAAYYLKPENNCLFAFPFPEWDRKPIGNYSVFHGEQQTVCLYVPTNRITGHTHHKDIYHHMHPAGAPGINVAAPCPQSKPHHLIDKQVYHLYGQQYYGGKLHIVGKCAYCGHENIFTHKEAKAACEYLTKVAESSGSEERREYLAEIVRRILATYEWAQ
jgi:hypothetical protein